MTIPVKTCSQLASCSANNWDILFSICTPSEKAAGIATPASPGFSTTDWPLLKQLTDVGVVDGLPNIRGEYSTTAMAASTRNGPTYGTGTWGSITGALVDDGNYAAIDTGASNTLSFDQFNNAHSSTPQNAYPGASEYIVLTGYGFNIPIDAVIVGIAVGIKCWVDISGINSMYPALAPGQRGQAPGPSPPPPFNNTRSYWGVANAALMLSGIPYFALDPNSNIEVDNGLSGSSQNPAVWRSNILSGAPYPAAVAGIIPFGPTKAEFAQGGSSGLSQPAARNYTADAFGQLTLFGDALLAVGMDGGGILHSLSLCPDPLDGTFLVRGPMAHNFSIPTLKQNWTPAEVNDLSFGIALNVGVYDINGVTPGPYLSSVQRIHYLNCAGVAIYYISNVLPGGVNPRRKRKLWTSS